MAKVTKSRMGTQSLTKTLCVLSVLSMPTALGATDNGTSKPEVMVQKKQGNKLSGLVVEAKTGEPILGASVRVVGENRGAVTNIDGKFVLDVPVGAKLSISYVGMRTLTVTISSASFGKQQRFALDFAEAALDEVVVTAYGGTQLKSKMTNSIAKVKNEVLKQGLYSNPAQALSGAVAGVTVRQTSGDPGAAPTIILRGGTSLDGSGSPLVIVDGQVRSGGLSDLNPEDIETMDVMKDAGATAIYGARANNGVILITTRRGKAGFSEIRFKAKVGFKQFRDNYEFLGAKDYLTYIRTAQYRGANVYTGDDGKSYGYFAGINDGSAGPLTLGNKYFDNNGNPLDGNQDASAVWSTMEYSDNLAFLLDQGWQTMDDPITSKKIIFSEHSLADENIRKTVPTQDYNLSLTGGNDRGSYYANLGYNYSEGNALQNWYKRLNFTINGDYKIKPWLVSNSGFQFTQAKWDDPNVNITNYFSRTLSVPPTLRHRNPAGELLVGPALGDGNYRTAMDKFTHDYTTNKFNLTQSLTATIFKGLSLKATGSWFISQGWNESFTKDYLDKPGVIKKERNTSVSTYEEIDQTYSLVANYNTTIAGKHSLAATAGVEYYDAYRKSLAASGKGAPTDDFAALGYTSSKEGERDISSGHTRQRILSYIGRVNYDYDGKYILSVVSRYDGYSKLIDNRWGFFPGISGGWVFSKEGFYSQSPLRRIINFGKLRTSFGVNGNVSGVGNYDLQGSYGTVQYGGQKGFLFSSLPNTGLRWEKSQTFEAGLDLGILENRFTLGVTYYNRLTVDKLASISIPSHTGISSVLTNNGKIRNRGVEIEANARLLNTKDWKLNVSANAAFNRNTIVQLPDNGLERNRQGASEVYTGNGEEKHWVGGYQEGQRPGDVYAYIPEGIYNDVSEIPGNLVDKSGAKQLLGPDVWAALPNKNGDTQKKYLPISAGDVRWKDVNGDGVIDQYDQEKVGNINPLVTGGINTSLSWKNLSLTLRMDYALGHVIYDQRTPWFLGAMQGTYNTVTLVKDSWSPENHNAKYPIYRYADQLGVRNYDRASKMFIYKADYLAFRELTLNYRLPKHWLKPLFVSSLDLSFTVQNLGYLTNKDAAMLHSPEASGSASNNGGYPLPRTFVFGLNVGF